MTTCLRSCDNNAIGGGQIHEARQLMLFASALVFIRNKSETKIAIRTSNIFQKCFNKTELIICLSTNVYNVASYLLLLFVFDKYMLCGCSNMNIILVTVCCCNWQLLPCQTKITTNAFTNDKLLFNHIHIRASFSGSTKFSVIYNNHCLSSIAYLAYMCCIMK